MTDTPDTYDAGARGVLEIFDIIAQHNDADRRMTVDMLDRLIEDNKKLREEVSHWKHIARLFIEAEGSRADAMALYRGESLWGE
jgi:hypothetical protein